MIKRRCGPTRDVAVCACGCSGYDERCDIYLYHYKRKSQVPAEHVCCSIPGRSKVVLEQDRPEKLPSGSRDDKMAMHERGMTE